MLKQRERDRRKPILGGQAAGLTVVRLYIALAEFPFGGAMFEE